MSRISVVVPCFNREAYLAESLHSAFEQTRRPHEVVVVDDGSTDGSREVAARYPVRLIALESNQGISAALNAGVRAAEGELVALLDSDDVWLPHHLERVAGLLDRFPEAAVSAGTGELFGDAGGLFRPRYPEQTPVNVFDEALYTWIVLPTVSIMRRDAVLAVGGYYEGDRHGNDYDLMLRLADRHPFVGTHEVTGRWRHHPDRLSAAYDRQLRSIFRHRLRFLDDVRREDPERAATLETRTRQRWRADMSEAWHGRDPTTFRRQLGLMDLVPGVPRLERQCWRVMGAVLGIASRR